MAIITMNSETAKRLGYFWFGSAEKIQKLKIWFRTGAWEDRPKITRDWDAETCIHTHTQKETETGETPHSVERDRAWTREN